MKRIIVTVGPAYLHNNIIKDNHQSRYIYRINGSHGTIKDIEQSIDLIREQVPKAEILIDLPGNKVRTANLNGPITLVIGQPFFLGFDQTNFKDF